MKTRWILALLLSGLSASADDWPQWRGPKRDGISAEKGLLDRWPEGGPPLAWEAKGMGNGYASVAVAGGRIYGAGKKGKAEQLVCLDAKDGKLLWTAELGAGGGSDGTPTVDGDLVFVLGKGGDLLCAESATGKEVWRKNFPKDFGGRMMSGWGWSESPLVDGDRLVCTPGAPDALMVALEKRTGNPIWKAPAPSDPGKRGQDGAGYSSIVISQAAGVKQYVQLTGRGVVGVRAEDGKPLWSYNRVANGTANIPTPIASGDHVFCSSGYGTGSALLRLTASGEGVAAQEVYFLKGDVLQNHHGGMILLGEQVYLGDQHNQGFPVCVDLATGKDRWRPGRGPGGGSAAVSLADGHLYFRYEDGTVALIQATPESYVLKGSFKIPGKIGKSWPHPAIADGKLYLREGDRLLCYDVRAK
jgi:outer membrane protein assembly factor BamB